MTLVMPTDRFCLARSLPGTDNFLLEASFFSTSRFKINQTQNRNRLVFLP